MESFKNLIPQVSQNVDSTLTTHLYHKSLSGSIWTAFTDLGLGPDVLGMHWRLFVSGRPPQELHPALSPSGLGFRPMLPPLSHTPYVNFWITQTVKLLFHLYDIADGGSSRLHIQTTLSRAATKIWNRLLLRQPQRRLQSTALSAV